MTYGGEGEESIGARHAESPQGDGARRRDRMRAPRHNERHAQSMVEGRWRGRDEADWIAMGDFFGPSENWLGLGMRW